MINNSVRVASANLDNISSVTAEDLPEIMEKDKHVFGADRTDVMKYYLSTFPDLCFKFNKDNKITGYSFGRRGKKFTQIGPLVADDCITAAELLRGILPILNGKTAVIDVIDTNLSFNDCLSNLGFIKQRPFIRMYKGQPRCFTRDEQYFAIAGPELG